MFDTKKDQPNQKKTFRQLSYIYSTVGVLCVYALIASQSEGMLALVNIVLSPVVDGLHLIGLGITKPFMEGPMPERFYTNLIGIGVYGVLAYNLGVIYWYMKVGAPQLDQQQANKQIETRQRIRDKWGLPGLWFAIGAAYFFLVLIAIYLVMSFLNGIHGWLVFSVHDFIVPPAFVMMWVYPGAFIVGFWLPIIDGLGGGKVLGICRKLLSGGQR